IREGIDEGSVEIKEDGLQRGHTLSMASNATGFKFPSGNKGGVSLMIPMCRAARPARQLTLSTPRAGRWC
ncbi:MAG: hypothetical protein U0984_10730, partial [Prosthecobacter sp.]|nr:hypothetical protein [Prosthecobacter sp.]